MMKLKKWSPACLLITAIVLLTGCTKDLNEVGIDIQPPGDKLNVVSTDTTLVVAYSQLVDSIKTDETSVSLLGSIVDPVFGRSTASIYTQLRLFRTGFSFGTNPVADSLILSLKYANHYGDSAAMLTLKVFELDESFYIDSSYYSHQTLAVKPSLLAQKTFSPDFKSNVIVGTDTLDPHLRINLGELTTDLMDRLVNIPSDSMASNESFLNYFKGLYLTVEDAFGGGIIIYFDMLSTLSGMELHYHNDDGDTLSYNYIINSNTGRFGHFMHDYSLGDPAFRAQVLENDTSLGQQICYVQALGGVKTNIRFPDIRHFYDDGKIAVNEARLFMKTYEEEPGLPLAKFLILVARKSDGGFTLLDEQLEGTTFFGGFYDKRNKGYWFRITSTVQELMRSTEPDYGFDLYLSGGSVNAERVLLVGPEPQLPVNPEDRMRLVVTYTRLN
ncbi:MAG: DUF4270 domain-containing protein [Bacteroidales bacterium]